MFEKSPRPVKREMTIGDKVITVVSRVTFDSLLRLSALLVLQLRTIRATKWRTKYELSQRIIFKEATKKKKKKKTKKTKKKKKKRKEWKNKAPASKVEPVEQSHRSINAMSLFVGPYFFSFISPV